MSIHHQTLVVYGWEIGKEAWNELQDRFGWRDKDVGEQHIEQTNVMKALSTRQKAELTEAKEQMGIESASGHPTYHVFTHVT